MTDNPYAAPAAVSDTRPQRNDFVLASRTIRLIAKLIDGAAFIAGHTPIFIAVLVVAALPGTDSAGAGGDVAQNRLLGAILLVSIFLTGLTLLALIILQIALLATRAQTVGKYLTKIYIVDSEGQPAEWWRTILLRTLPFWIVAYFTCVVINLVDWVFIFREDRCCLHDLLADTDVAVKPANV